MRDKVAVVPKTDLLACVPIFASGLDLRFDLPDKVVAPCRRGTVIGRAYVYLGSDVVGRAELMTGAYVSSKTPASLAVRAASWLTKAGPLAGVLAIRMLLDSSEQAGKSDHGEVLLLDDSGESGKVLFGRDNAFFLDSHQ